MKVVKSCNIKFRPEGIYVWSNANTPYGGIANTPFTKLNSDIDGASLGKLLLELLQSIPDTVTDVDLASRGQQYREHLRSLGFKTDSAFAKNASFISVEVFDGCIAVVPYKSAAGGGYLPLTDKRKFSPPSSMELGQLVLDQRILCL